MGVECARTALAYACSGLVCTPAVVAAWRVPYPRASCHLVAYNPVTPPAPPASTLASPPPPPRPLLQRVIELGADFQPAVLCHPDTYLNKVLVGSGAAGGRMQLWNFRTGSMLYEFKGWCVWGRAGCAEGMHLCRQCEGTQ